MPRGGRRPNQTGRPKGAHTKRTRAIAEQAALTGKTPLEVMLEGMRHYLQEAASRDTPAGQEAALDKAMILAKDAAPYMHPRLASVEHGGKDGEPIKYIVRWEK